MDNIDIEEGVSVDFKEIQLSGRNYDQPPKENFFKPYLINKCCGNIKKNVRRES